MKKLLLLIILAQCIILNAQKIYLDENKVQVVDPSNARYYRIVETENDSNAYDELNFYLTGEKESENSFVNSSGKFVKNGKSLSWYINGQLKSESNYIKGKLNGKESTYYDNGQLKSEINNLDNQDERQIETYWKNGKIKRRDFFRKGQLQTGVCFDSLGNEIKHFDYEIMPQYKGGDQRLLNDIVNNIEYPIKSKEMGIQGRVLVRFAVGTDGSISSVSVMEGVSPALNAEAIRVVKTLKRFKPGLQDGEPVPVFYAVPISFNLR